MTKEQISEELNSQFDNLRHVLIEGARRGVVGELETVRALEQLHTTMFVIDMVLSPKKGNK
jgi:mannitol-specific phosphotransferase system IIBC component